MKHLNLKSIALSFLAIFSVALTPAAAFADEEAETVSADPQVAFQISPMNQKITLIPGERYYGTFKITNPATSQYAFAYKATVGPFTVDESYTPLYENNGDYNQITDWTTVINDTGVISPNDTAIVEFYVDVPSDAPAGGQYVAITVSSNSDYDPTEESGGVALHAKYAIAHLVYGEVAGETVRSGDVTNVGVPGFLFSGDIAGTASIKNTGNVHSDATYTLQIFPLFSGEEVYTNAEDPMTNTILPGATRTTTLSWGETPSIGIFHVIYNVEFEGVNSKVDKIVIICPLWLLFLIILAIFLIIFKIWSGKKNK